MPRKSFLCALLAAATFTAASAQAEEREVLVLGSGFFPGIVYADAGDTIRFVNESDQTQYIIGSGDHWMIGPIGTEAEAEFVIPEGMRNLFVSTTDATAVWDDFDFEAVEPIVPNGVVNFGAPPLG